jgi:hypothetical protein
MLINLLQDIEHWFQAHVTTAPAIIAALAAFVIFLLTRIAEIIGHWTTVRSTRKRLIVGLYREIRSNVKSIEAFLDAQPHPTTMREKVIKDRHFRPLMIVDETTQFHDSNMASLPMIRSSCLLILSEFYDQMRRVNGVKDAFESNAFSTISAEGRAGTVDDLWQGCQRAAEVGRKALDEFELAYPRKWFVTFRS